MAKCVFLKIELENPQLNRVKGLFILLCRFISLNRPKKFEFGATFAIVDYTLNWFWFVFTWV